METKKCILFLAIIVLLLSGISYATVVYNSTPKNDSTPPTTIIVTGDGSSGTGDVTNIQVASGETVVQGDDDLKGETSTPKAVVNEPDLSASHING